MLSRTASQVLRLGAQQARAASNYCMDPSIGLTSEQIDIQRMAADFARKEMLPKMAEWDENEHLPLDVLRKCGDLGFGAIYCKEDYGGAALSRLDSSIVFEELSKGCTSTVALMTVHNTAVWIIDNFGSEALREKCIPTLATFENLASYCLTEPDAGSDAAALRTTARREGDYYVVNGSKAFITGGGVSKYYVVMVRHEGVQGPKGVFCLLIEKDTEGFSFGKKEKKMGWNSQPTRMLTFEDVKVPVSNQIGGDNQGFNIAMAGINGGRLNIASCSLGAAQISLDLTIEHLKVRKQFEKTLSEFQWNQFKLAEMATKIHASRLMIRHAARHLDENSIHKASLCAMAKLYTTDAAFEVINQGLQMFGGYGFLKDYPIQQYCRDSRAHQIIGGSNEVMRMLLARDLLTKTTAFTQ